MAQRTYDPPTHAAFEDGSFTRKEVWPGILGTLRLLLLSWGAVSTILGGEQ
jgi:hypothetical protein